MKNNLKQILATNYILDIDSIVDGPRQFVAETFIISTKSQEKYFRKVINNKLFIDGVIASLPALKNIHHLGFDQVNYPISTKSGDLYVYENNALVVLLNYINAPQNYDYDYYILGKTLAQVHQLTSKVTAPIPKENFQYKHLDIFEDRLHKIINFQDSDEINSKLSNLLSERQTEILDFYKEFLQVSEDCQNKKYELFITHGDSPGNVLVKSPKDIYIIDWDDILLAPVERDLWFLKTNQNFMSGYQFIFPEFSFNEQLTNYYILSRYFNDLIEYWADITGPFDSSHRLSNFEQMRKELFKKSGWLYPVVKGVKL